MKDKFIKPDIRTDKNADDNVGIKLNNENLRITFPKMMDESTYNFKNTTLLNKVLEKYKKREKQRNVYYRESYESNIEKSSNFNLEVLFELMESFKREGYYINKNRIFSKNKGKKIDFKRTIKKCTPINIEGQYLYNDHITRVNRHDKEDLVRLIHMFCIEDIWNKLNIFYKNIAIAKGCMLPLNSSQCINFLKNELYNTFDDKNSKLISNLIAYLSQTEQNKNNKFEFFLYAKSFEYIWEEMIKNLFSNQNEKNFYFKSHWQIKDCKDPKSNSNSRLDCIRIEEDELGKNLNVYIIDAKYFSYDNVSDEGDLPGTKDINKQVGYKLYVQNIVENKYKYKNYENINYYNIFILPNTCSSIIECFGKCYSEFNKNELIYGLYLDVQYTMKNYINKNNLECIKELKKLCKKWTRDKGNNLIIQK